MSIALRPIMGTDVTEWIQKLQTGEQGALDELMPALYHELRRVARGRMRGEHQNLTLSTTALVHEAYLKLRQQHKINTEDRTQFLAVAGITMRRILVDYARTRKRSKRGGGARPVLLEDVEPFLTDSKAEEVVALDEALERWHERPEPSRAS